MSSILGSSRGQPSQNRSDGVCSPRAVEGGLDEELEEAPGLEIKPVSCTPYIPTLNSPITDDSAATLRSGVTSSGCRVEPTNTEGSRVGIMESGSNNTTKE